MDEALRIGLVAGEPSGDRLGAALITEIRRSHPRTQFEGIAGPQMREAGCQVLAGAEQLAVMGLAEVLRHLPALLLLRSRISRHFRHKPPHVFVGIDAPDFNLTLEQSLKRAGVPTVHWVSPSVWAWRQYRLGRIRRSVDLLLTLFPFEADFLQQHGVRAQFVGHPLADEISTEQSRLEARDRLGLDRNRPCIALLPGSRQTEVRRLLPVFLEAAQLCGRKIPGLQLVLPVAAPGLLPTCQARLGPPRQDRLAVMLLEGRARESMRAADAVLLASGTVALECMLIGRPMVVAYRLHPLTYQLVRHMLRVPFVSLPNLLLGTQQVPEFLQANATPDKLAGALLELLQQPQKAARQIEPFAGMHLTLGQNAAQRAARHVIETGLS